MKMAGFMKKVVIMIALIFFYLSNSISADGKLKDIIKKAKGAVVCVLNYNSSGKAQGRGTGFFINDTGYIVTNVHVVKDAEKVVVKTLDGTMYNLSKVVNSNEDDDLFIFTVDGIISAANYLDLNTKKLDVGDEVMAIGNPLGLEQTVSTGIISGIRELKEFGYLYQITAPVSPGSSGGPVVDYDGNVIGVAFLQAKIGQNLNFAMPSYKIAKLMENSAFIDFK